VEWEGREESQNVEDRRSLGRTGLAVGGGVVGLVVMLIAAFLGINPQQLGGLLGGNQSANRAADPEEERLAKFTRVVLRDTEVVWDQQFRDLSKKLGKNCTYRKPTLVMFTGHVDSACGSATAAVGPFYCPGDEKIYIDLSFYRELDKQLGAPGEFARAYVIAHEVGHHVQHLLGRELRGPNPYTDHESVRTELQADYLAGVWAKHGDETFKFLQKGDIESASNAAFHIGDDVLQKRSRGYVTPDTFTHGSADERQYWFLEGFRTGDVLGARRLFSVPYDDLRPRR